MIRQTFSSASFAIRQLGTCIFPVKHNFICSTTELKDNQKEVPFTTVNNVFRMIFNISGDLKQKSSVSKRKPKTKTKSHDIRLYRCVQLLVDVVCSRTEIVSHEVKALDIKGPHRIMKNSIWLIEEIQLQMKWLSDNPISQA